MAMATAMVTAPEMTTADDDDDNDDDTLIFYTI